MEHLFLRPLTCWDRGFESHRGHGYLSVVSVVCCQVEVSATSWSLVRGVLPTVLRRRVWSRNIKKGCSIYVYDISRLRVNQTSRNLFAVIYCLRVDLSWKRALDSCWSSRIASPCGTGSSPSRDLSLLGGRWRFFSLEATKVSDFISFGVMEVASFETITRYIDREGFVTVALRKWSSGMPAHDLLCSSCHLS